MLYLLVCRAMEAHDRAQLEARARYRNVLLQKIEAVSAVQTFWPCFVNIIRKKKEPEVRSEKI